MAGAGGADLAAAASVASTGSLGWLKVRLQVSAGNHQHRYTDPHTHIPTYPHTHIQTQSTRQQTSSATHSGCSTQNHCRHHYRCHRQRQRLGPRLPTCRTPTQRSRWTSWTCCWMTSLGATYDGTAASPQAASVAPPAPPRRHSSPVLPQSRRCPELPRAQRGFSTLPPPAAPVRP